jgi:hypothetical protein
MTDEREATGTAAPGSVADESPSAATAVAEAIGDPDAQTLTIEADAAAPPQSVGRQGGTFESFHYRDFRLFWSGALVSNIGSWMQAYALGIVVFGLRGSSFDLGLENFQSGLPVLVLALPAGAIADRVDRRRLLIVIQVVLLLQAAALGALYNGGWPSDAPCASQNRLPDIMKNDLSFQTPATVTPVGDTIRTVESFTCSTR